MTLGRRMLKLHPATLILASFLAVIVAGAALLQLPWSTVSGHIRWIDALFTATSAVCVTGLVVLDTGSYFTVFGQLVILSMIQVGGLGVMTVSVALFQWAGRMVSFRQRMLMQDLFAHTPRKDILGLVKSTVLFTLGAEALGAVVLAVGWSRTLPWPEAIYTAVFHSVSAFCNAGFSLFADSLMAWRGDGLINLAVCLLIVFGGIGFPVIYEFQSRLVHPRKRARLSIHTKTVLITTGILIVGGALMFAFLERSLVTDCAVPLSSRLLVPLFQSVTSRTAGFNTVDIGALNEATLALIIFLMFFGASPGSCGGGVKTTTLAVITAFTVSRIRRCARVNIFHKSLPPETVSRSIALILAAVAIVSLVLFMLLAGEAIHEEVDAAAHPSFLAYLFETVSAFGTVGLSMGVTPLLSLWGKVWIILTMLVGRVGVLTFAYIIVGAGAINGIQYAEENLMTG
jgi:trk system potassium uptake protein TrkH